MRELGHESQTFGELNFGSRLRSATQAAIEKCNLRGQSTFPFQQAWTQFWIHRKAEIYAAAP